MRREENSENLDTKVVFSLFFSMSFSPFYLKHVRPCPLSPDLCALNSFHLSPGSDVGPFQILVLPARVIVMFALFGSLCSQFVTFISQAGVGMSVRLRIPVF